MITLSNLDWVDGKSNPVGIRSIGYFIRKADIVKPYPQIAPDGVSYVGDIELAKTTVFKTLYTTQGVGKIDFEMVGNKDCKQPVNKASLSYPDIDSAARTFATSYCNSNVVFIIPHNTSSGVSYAVFGLEMDADVKITGTSGDKAGSDKGMKIEIESPDFVVLPAYKGLIPIDTGTLDCSTGDFTPAPTTPPVG